MRRLHDAGRDDRGSAMVVAFLMMLTLTGGSILWLSRDVDRAVNARAQADSLAFQTARQAAQAIEPASLRDGTPRIAAAAAVDRAEATFPELAAAIGVEGRVVTTEVREDRVTVTVELSEAGRTVTGRATARLAVGITQEGD